MSQVVFKKKREYCREFVVYQNQSTPPTTTSIITQINICEALNIPDEKDNDDICTKGAVSISFFINSTN